MYGSDLSKCADLCRENAACSFLSMDVDACDTFTECNVAVLDRFMYDYSDIESLKSTVFHPARAKLFRLPSRPRILGP